MAREIDDKNMWLRLLRFICPDHMYEEIEGDLIQKFNHDIKKFHERKAKRRLIWNAIRFIRPGIILRHNPSINLTSYHMLRNYFKVAMRVMFRNKTYSAINIAGTIAVQTLSAASSNPVKTLRTE